MAILRPAGADDAEGIARVHIDTWRSTYRGLMPEDVLARLSMQEKRSRWETSLRQPNRTSTVVAMEDDGVIGFASFGPEPGNDYHYQGELYAIYVLQEKQGRGIGTQLLRAAAKGLLERNFPNMMLWVLATNPARQFYEKLGGQYLRDRDVELTGALLHESAHGWADLTTLANEER